MAINVVSFGGHAINDEVSYSAYTLLDEAAFDRAVDTVEHVVPGRHPTIIRTQPIGQRFPLHVTIRGGSLRDRRDELNRWFAKGTTADLVVTFDDSTRALACTVVRVMPFDRTTVTFSVLLYAPDPRWRSSLQQCTSNGGIAFSGDLIDDVVRAADVEGDGYGANQDSVGIHTATTNLITNGGAETNTTGWATAGTNTLSRSTSQAKFGSAAFSCQIGNSATIATYSIGLSSSTVYSFSGWIYLDAGWTGGDIALDLGSGFTDTTVENQIMADGTRLQQWQRVTAKITTQVAAPGTGNIRIRAQGSVTALQVARFDGMQLEVSAFPTPYVETDGGTAARTDGVVKVQSSVLDESQGWVAARVRMGMENDPSGVTVHEPATVFDWRLDGSNYLRMSYLDSALGTDAWKFSRSGSDVASVADTVAWSEVFTVIGTWEDGRVRLSVNGATFTSTVGSAAPALAAITEWYIGSIGGTSEHLGGEILWIAAGTGLLTDDDADSIHEQGGGSANLLLKTEKFNASQWSKSGSIDADSLDDPIGGTTADTWTTNTTAGPVVYQQLPGDPVPSTAYTASVYVKAKRAADVGVKVRLKVDDNGADSSDTTYVLTAAWVRITHTHTFGGSPTGAPRWNLVLHVDSEGVANKIGLWGAQLEVGSSATDYVAVDLGNDLPRSWSEDSGKCFEWDAAAASVAPFDFTVENAGNAEDDQPVIRLQPITQKAAANSWIYKREVIVANRVENAFADYALCLTDDGSGGGFDHAAEVTAGRSLASGNDVRVLLDGVETPRWDGGGSASSWNDMDLLLWINVTLSPGLRAELDAAVTAGSPANGGDLSVIPGGTAGWPSSGALLVDDEVILYEGITDDAFTGVTRGVRNTTAASHSAADICYWVERRIQIIYGYTGASAPDARLDRKPLLNLDLSDNTFHQWPTFASEDPRSMQWTRVLRDRNRQKDRILAEGPTAAADLTALSFAFDNDGPSAGLPNFNGWRRPIPAGTKYPTGTFVSSTATVPDTMILNFWFVDGDGNEVLHREQFSASGTTTAVDGASPYFAIEFEGKGAHVVTGPTSTEIADTTISTIGNREEQLFTVPDGFGKAAYIQAVSLRLKCTATGSVDLSIRIVKLDDATGTFVGLTVETKTVTASGSYAWIFVKFTNKIQVFPGDQLAVQVDLDAKNSGATDIRWETYNQSFEGGTTVKGFRILSNSLDHNENATGVDGDEITIDDVGITHDTAGIPYVSLKGQESVYWLAGTVTNVTTGDSFAIAAAVSVGDVVAIDVGAKTVTNETTGESIFWAITPTDEENWLTFVPGVNELAYTESGAVAVLVAAYWYSRWEA